MSPIIHLQSLVSESTLNARWPPDGQSQKSRYRWPSSAWKKSSSCRLWGWMFQPSRESQTGLERSCSLWYDLEEKVCTVYKPRAASLNDDRMRGGGGVEVTRWLKENEWANALLLPDWCLSFVTLRASDLTTCVCVLCCAAWGLCLTPFIINDTVLGGSCIDVRALSTVKGSGCWKSPQITGSK